MVPGPVLAGVSVSAAIVVPRVRAVPVLGEASLVPMVVLVAVLVVVGVAVLLASLSVIDEMLPVGEKQPGSVSVRAPASTRRYPRLMGGDRRSAAIGQCSLPGAGVARARRRTSAPGGRRNFPVTRARARPCEWGRRSGARPLPAYGPESRGIASPHGDASGGQGGRAHRDCARGSLPDLSLIHI